LVVLIAGAYFGAAKLGIDLPVSQGVITPVWAPSGIALAALLILGVRYWPAVAVAAFAANATSEATLAVAAGISVGNTLAAVVGALLIARIGFTPALDRVRSVLALVVGGALADERLGTYGSAWLLWWFGDAMGVLVVAPMLSGARQQPSACSSHKPRSRSWSSACSSSARRWPNGRRQPALSRWRPPV
jgi:integral membrane sensor domain MASE1